MTKLYSPHKGGTGAIEFLMRTRCNRNMTEAQASALWEECKAQLLRVDLGETVEEVEQSEGGSLDTLPRSDVLSAIANVLTGSDWPINASSDAESDAFINKMGQAFAQRGYTRIQAGS